MDKAPVGAWAGGGMVGDSGKVLPHQINGYPRDPHLLREFEAEEEDADGVELKLTLSMGGRFGIDPLEKERLLRSSSIGGLAALPNYDDLIGRKGVAGVVGGGGGRGLPPLGRTVSLPVQTEDNLRKRKELQSLRRLEAKRKRSEKQRNSNGRLVSSGKEADMKVGGEDDKSKVVHLTAKGFPAGVWPAPAVSQGSAGSQCSGSSSTSEVEGRSAAAKGTGGNEVRTPTRVQSPTRAAGASLSAAGEDSAAAGREVGRSVVGEMPCVSTTGCGPNGRRVEGFLYKFRKGEEVSIVCVCHGTFLTPAEFVRHAGGGDVAHPLRHITVNTSPSTTFS